ncbi:MAG: hypothetical protein AAF800_00130 [Planctomycetota bacterium]
MLRAAEALHDALDPDRTYPFDFVAYRLTGYRRDYGDDSLLVGEAVAEDLRLLIDRLSRGLDLSPSDGDTRTVDQVAAALGVSTKTLSRWRKDGLRWRWVRPLPGARRVLGFPAAALDHYDRLRPGRLERAARFTAVSDEERAALLRRARRITERVEVAPRRVAEHLARRSGRAVETLRLLMARHDREHPDHPIFPDRGHPLTPRQRRVIARARRRGVPVSRLAERFDRTPAAIHRVLLDRRAADARRVDLTHVPHPQFDRPDAAEVYLRPIAGTARFTDPFPPDPSGDAGSVLPDDFPPVLRPLFAWQPLPPPALRSLVLRMNFLKHRAEQTRRSFAGRPARAAELSLFETDVAAAARLRGRLAAAHLPLTVSVARRQLVGQATSGPVELLRLVETALPVLTETLDRYDATQRPRLGSVLRNRLLRRFADTRPDPDHPARARRRESPEAAADRLLAEARRLGVGGSG